jgi:RNA polymerase sigma factor (TIGR02999 family)
MAAGRLRGERPGHTLQATALVHELFLKMADGAIAARDRRHFMGVAARAMRQILVDHARRKMADKRGGGAHHTTLGGHDVAVRLDPAGLLDLDRALDGLDERQRKVVELRFFVGLEEREIAEALDVSERTVRRDWVKARAWLYAALYGEEDGSSAGAHVPGASSPPESTGGARAA